jgi:hypothetical protein
MTKAFGTYFVPATPQDDCPQCTWFIWIDVTAEVAATSGATVKYDETAGQVAVTAGGGGHKTAKPRKFVQPKRGRYDGSITEFVRMTGLPVTHGVSHPAHITSVVEQDGLVHIVEVIK